MIFASVIIPVYNRTEQLKNAIQSILVQDFQEFEIIIVDDYSSIQIKSFIPSDNRIRVIRHKCNKGAAAARNTGIINAKGDLVAFIDSDDYWFPQKLKYQVEAFKKRGDLDLCFCSYELVKETKLGKTKKIYYSPKVPPDGNWYRHLLLGCDLGPGSTMLAHKDLFIKYGLFNEKYPRHEDWEWLLRVSRKKRIKIKVLDKALVSVQNLSIPSAKSVEIANNKIIQEYESEFQKYKSYGKKAISKRNLETSIYLFKENDFKKALLYFFKGFLVYPFHRVGYYALIIEAMLGISIEDYRDKKILCL